MKTLILFENQIQTASTSSCRTQVQPAASFLVCSLIFIEYNIPIQELEQCLFQSLSDFKQIKTANLVDLPFIIWVPNQKNRLSENSESLILR